MIVSRKIGKKSFDHENVEDLKIVFSTYMYTLLHHDKNYLDLARHLNIILDTLATKAECLKNLPEETEFGFKFDRNLLLAHMVLYASQAKYSDERTAALKNFELKFKEDLDNHPSLKKLVKGLLGKELIGCEVSTYGADSMQYFQATEEDR